MDRAAYKRLVSLLSATGRVFVQGPESQDLRGASPEFIILDEYASATNIDFTELESRLMPYFRANSEEFEAYKRDPEAYMDWLETAMSGGPQFYGIKHNPLSIPIDVFVSNDPGFPSPNQPWVKNRSHSFAGYEAQFAIRKRKRLEKRAKNKANRRRARQK